MFIRFLIALLLLLPCWPASADAWPFFDERLGFTVPAAPWTLTLPADYLVVKQRQIKPDGRYGYFLVLDEKRNLTISFFIEPAAKCNDSQSCRDMVWKLGNPSWENPQNVVQSEIGDVSYFEFFMPTFRGVAVKQQHMYAQFVKDGFWVDMHISKVLSGPEEHQLFEQIVKSVVFEAK